MKVISFFAGCGGLDLGFERAGYKVVWANEIETSVHATYEKNHPSTILCKDDINVVSPNDVPDCDGFIGGPPCQSWSVAGKQQGLDDKRGQLFLTYISMIRAKMPKFFVIENVKGLLDEKFKDVFENFLTQLDEIGYDVKYRLLDAVDYDVPQNRERIFLIGFRHDLGIDYHFPRTSSNKPLTLKDAIGNITAIPIPCEEDEVMIDSNSYYSGKFGSHYYRGNRRRNWDKPSFTIHATGYNIPLHPSSPNMIYNAHEDWSFIKGKYREYRRLTVRECARIQTFPDNFEIDCPNIIDAYKMIGNAVPVRMAEILATSIKEAIEKSASERKQQRGDIKPEDRVLVGFYKGYPHWKIITHQGFYYVRADGRKGAMSIEDLMPLPRLLLLHSNDKMQLYEMTDIEPRYYGKDYIQRLGFEPSGETYLGVGFDTSSKYKLKEVGINKDNIIQKERFAPYITTIQELTKKNMSLKFIDLFAGLGGFHFALSELGHKCVFASELLDDLRELYTINFPGTRIEGDITKINPQDIPNHDILCAGFPCQPFSKAGFQRGFDDEGRGNMFDYICEIIRAQGDNRPKILLLENVANLKGHDNGRTWSIIQEKLDALGYWTKAEILSPHQFGYPQHRKRMYIVGLRKDKGNLESFSFPVEKKESECDIHTIINEKDTNIQPLKLETIQQLKVWQFFLQNTLKHGGTIPSFPIWAMEFGADYPYENAAPYSLDAESLRGKHGRFGQVIDGSSFEEQLKQLPIYSQPSKRVKSKQFPGWKVRYIKNNRFFYENNKDWLDKWIENIRTWDNSFQKLEWNCGPDDKGNLYDKIIQFRASGIRVKLPTWSPALNLVGSQVPILPWIKLPKECIPNYTEQQLKKYGLSKRDISRGRYLSVKEAATLQGMELLDFSALSTTRAYEALGNAVNTQVVKKIAQLIINHYEYGRN